MTLFLGPTFKTVILTGSVSVVRIKGTLYFLQVNQKFIPEHTAMLLLKYSKARLSWPVEEWIGLLLPYFNRAQVQADEYVVLSPSKLQSSLTI